MIYRWVIIILYARCASKRLFLGDIFFFKSKICYIFYFILCIFLLFFRERYYYTHLFHVNFTDSIIILYSHRCKCFSAKRSPPPRIYIHNFTGEQKKLFSILVEARRVLFARALTMISTDSRKSFGRKMKEKFLDRIVSRPYMYI